MKLITSRNNPLYREIRQLASNARARRKTTRTILDGVHLCQAYLQYVGNPLFCVVNESSKNQPEIAEIYEECHSRQVSCIFLRDFLYDDVSQVDEGVGVLFLIEPPVYSAPARMIQTAVLLDRIQDPGNMGSILRSASAAGISEVFCSEGSAAVWSPRVLRAGMGAHFMIRIYENADLARLADDSGVPVVATVPDAEKSIYDVDLKRPVAWLFGHEGQGISDVLQSKAGMTANIPHAGKQDSLNVAACAAICFFEQLRQKRAG
ncbi:RNA methyltransferase [Oxalobacter sp. OttesenSCG-928-P03]|nr:RNA methyltransferase [Oxalobacter sp. OttesenSCG-928-P03]